MEQSKIYFFGLVNNAPTKVLALVKQAGARKQAEQHLHAVVLPRPVVVRWNSLLIFSLCAGIAVGFHELPMSEKNDNPSSDLFFHPEDIVMNE